MDDEGWGLAGLAVAAAGLAAISLLIGLISLVIPFGAPDSLEEGYDLHDCGSPGAFVAGNEDWFDRRVVATTLPGDESSSNAINAIPRHDSCPRAIGSRLRFTVWAFGIGLVAAVGLGVLAPGAVWSKRRRRDRQPDIVRERL